MLNSEPSLLLYGEPMRAKLTLAGMLTAVAGALVLAASVHFVSGPTLVDNGVTVTATGKLAGLGQGDVTIVVNATGTATVQCTNPAGTVAPGQTKVINASGSQTLASPKNGTVTFSVSTLAPSIPSSACPNDQWTAEAVDVKFTSATVTVLQGGQVVLQQTFS